MAKRANDIVELERKLDDAASDSELNELAKEIAQRIHVRLRKAKAGFNLAEIEKLRVEIADFRSVIGAIRARKHDHVLDDYDRFYVKERIDLT